MNRWILILAAMVGVYALVWLAVGQPETPVRVTYRTTPQGPLDVSIFCPDGNSTGSELAPAAVFFHGGGWISGRPEQFFDQAADFAAVGVVSIVVEYRVESRHGTRPVDAMDDAVAALEWTRSQAESLGIDPNRVAAVGTSAGGQLAAYTAVVGAQSPDALILYNPVLDNGPSGYGNDRVGPEWPSLSPYHNLSERFPPTLIMVGELDDVALPAMLADTSRQLDELGVENTLIIYEGASHGFFNKVVSRNAYESTTGEALSFLAGGGWIEDRETGGSARRQSRICR